MRIYIDMDGVIANFDKAAKEGEWKHRPDLHVNYRNLEVINGAIESLAKLNADHEIFIASTPPWTRPEGSWFWFNKDWDNRNWKACLEYVNNLNEKYEKV